MRLAVRLDPHAVRRWHLEVLAALADRPGLVVEVVWSRAPREPARDVEGLLTLERALHRLPVGRSGRVAAGAFATYRGRVGEPEVVLDLVGDAADDDARTWHLTFDGAAGEDALLAALLAGRSPVVRVVDLATGRTLASGRPGTEYPSVVVAALEDVLAGCTQLVHAAIDGRGGPDLEDGAPVALRRGDVLRHGARSLVSAAVHRVYRQLYRAPHWRVGWRWVAGPDVVDLGGLPSGWRELPDDGWHFYADPFPVVVDGVTHLFVEDYDHRVGRGVISAVPFDEEGPTGTPRTVLEHHTHLSYPFVLEDAGQVWMIPETSGAGTVELYRARRFPDDWVREEVLLEGMQVSDATPFRHGGRWWLSGTVRAGGSYSDALHLWSADRLQGPWHPHPGNPVLIDIAAARPGGRVVRRSGRLVRPVQDGRAGYGAALALAEITRLDTEAFEQRVVATITPGPAWPGSRLHTLNRAGDLEVIDGSAYSPRLRRLPLPRR